MSKPVILDNKRRASFGTAFRPGDSFVRSVDGNRVVFEKVEVSEDAPLVKTRTTKEGWLMLVRPLDRKKVVASIRADREAR